jgi:hypothetical protein
MNIKNIHIFGGGTVAHITSHFAISAPAYGTTAKQLQSIIVNDKRFENFDVNMEFTKMAGGALETNEDIAHRIETLKSDTNTKIIFFNCALVDWDPKFLSSAYPLFDAQTVIKCGQNSYMDEHDFGKHTHRIESKGITKLHLSLTPTSKLIPSIRQGRKDIFLIGFKTTCGATKREMYLKGLRLCKEGSVNLVLVNDVKTRWNMIVTPEEAAYHETDDRHEVLKNLVEMTYYRSHLTFTQSTVIDGNPVTWDDPRIPHSLRTIVEHCIDNKAYKKFNGSTVGHFAIKLSDTEFLTSIRKSDFNKIKETGMVYVKTDGPDTVLAYGAKPSVGGQSQRIVFREHEGMDCIVHFHCPLRKDAPLPIPVRSQREVECGSHQCGKNTSDGLAQFGNLKAVYLDQHGPNIVFNKNINPQEIIDFIEQNFNLSQKTGGYNL